MQLIVQIPGTCGTICTSMPVPTQHIPNPKSRSQLQKHLPGALNVIDASTCEVEVQQPPKASIKPLEEEM